MTDTSLFREFLTRLDNKFADDSEQMSTSQWILKNTRLRGRPFSFTGYEFQRQIVDDLHPNMSVIKCSQIGLTEVQIRKYFTVLKRTSSINGIFSLPTDEMFKKVSQTRIKPLIDKTEAFNQHDPAEKPIRSMSNYQIYGSFGFVTGAKEGDATSINADIMMNDEVDLTDQEMLSLFASRLQGSSLRIRQGFSTPTFEGFGIDSSYKASDQHEYLCRCGCGHWNLPTFEPRFLHLPGLSGDLNDLSEIDPDIAAKLDFEESYIRCERCGAALDLADPAMREWVPRHPGRLGRGYWVRPFSTSRLSIQYVIEQLLDYKRKNSLRRWYNTVLGQPFNDSNARLSLTEIEAIMKGEGEPDVSSDVPVVLGCDVGQTCHLVLAHLGLALPTVFSWRQIPAENLVDEIRAIRDRYKLIAGAIDLNPYAPLSKEIRDVTDGIVAPVEYAVSGAAVDIKTDEFERFSHVRAHRTTAIDEVVRAVRKRETNFVGYGIKKHIISQHLQDMVRIEQDEKPAVWNKLTGDDHFFHALVYLFLSMKIRDVKNHNTDVDERIMSLFFGAQIVQQTAEHLGFKGKIKNPSVLGLS